MELLATCSHNSMFLNIPIAVSDRRPHKPSRLVRRLRSSTRRTSLPIFVCRTQLLGASCHPQLLACGVKGDILGRGFVRCGGVVLSLDAVLGLGLACEPRLHGQAELIMSAGSRQQGVSDGAVSKRRLLSGASSARGAHERKPREAFRAPGAQRRHPPPSRVSGVRAEAIRSHQKPSEATRRRAPPSRAPARAPQPRRSPSPHA